VGIGIIEFHQLESKDLQQPVGDLVDAVQAHRDIVVSYSINVGRQQICMWASGRITLFEDRPFVRDRIKIHNNVEIEEIAPPYDFLQ